MWLVPDSDGVAVLTAGLRCGTRPEVSLYCTDGRGRGLTRRTGENPARCVRSRPAELPRVPTHGSSDSDSNGVARIQSSPAPSLVGEEKYRRIAAPAPSKKMHQRPAVAVQVHTLRPVDVARWHRAIRTGDGAVVVLESLGCNGLVLSSSAKSSGSGHATLAALIVHFPLPSAISGRCHRTGSWIRTPSW